MERDPAVGMKDEVSRRTRERLEAAYPSRSGSAAQMRKALRGYLSERALDAAWSMTSCSRRTRPSSTLSATPRPPMASFASPACVSDGEAAVEVRDGGGGFELRPPGPRPFPDVRRASGRGVFLIERLMDEVSVRSGRRGTTVRMVRRLG